MPDDLDPVLDEALKAYSNPQIRMGLEQRILRRVSEPRPKKVLRLAAVAVVLVIALAVMTLWRQQPVRPVKRQPVQSAAVNPRNGPRLPGPSVPVKTVLRRRGRRFRPEPKLAHFPAPTPLTEDERALLRLAKNDPKTILPDLSKLEQPIKPIEVVPIKIEPISEEE